MRCNQALLCLFSLGLALGCGGGGSRTPDPGSLTLLLGSDSFPGYSQAVVSVERVDGSADGANWQGLGAVKATFDLVKIQNGSHQVLLTGVSVPSGTYNYFRITWASVNYADQTSLPAYITPSGGQGSPLAMPTSGTTVVPGTVVVPASGAAQAQIMLSGQQAIQTHTGTSSPTFTFQANGQAYDLGRCAQITGHLGDGATNLSGVEVYAETVDGLFMATIQRRAFTDGSGNYVLEALPMGILYYVVAQPAGSASSYPALATAVNATAAITYGGNNLAFTSPLAPGSLNLSVTPASAANTVTWGELRQNLSTNGSVFQTLIVRSQTLATSASIDQTGFLGVYPNPYGVTVQRSVGGAVPVMKIDLTQPIVNSGTVSTVSLSYP